MIGRRSPGNALIRAFGRAFSGAFVRPVARVRVRRWYRVQSTAAPYPATARLRLLRLVHLLQRIDHVRIRERRRIAERATFRDVAQEATHDLARASLREVGREQDVVRARDRAD